MAKPGDVIENPLSGQRLIFHKTAKETGGELLEVESVYTKPTPSRPPVHYHPHQEERFEVLSGTVRMLVDGKERILGTGEVITIPPGTPHEMSADEAGVRVNWQTRPALQTEAFFEAMWGLARDGKTDEKGVPNLLQMAVILRKYEDEIYLASLRFSSRERSWGCWLSPGGCSGTGQITPIHTPGKRAGKPAEYRVRSGEDTGSMAASPTMPPTLLPVLGAAQSSSSRPLEIDGVVSLDEDDDEVSLALKTSGKEVRDLVYEATPVPRD